MAAPKYNEVLSEFIADIDYNPNMTDEEIYQAYPEFNNDKSMLEAAFAYRNTYKENKYDEATLQSKFPEFFGGAEPQPQVSSQPQQSIFGRAKEWISEGLKAKTKNEINAQPQVQREMTRKQELERQKAATLPVSTEDVARQREQDRLMQEGAFGKPNGTRITYDPQTGLPSITKTEGDGLHLFTGLNGNQSEIDRLEQEKPAYLTRKNDTEENIVSNIRDAWTANTEEGRAEKVAAERRVEEMIGSFRDDFERSERGKAIREKYNTEYAAAFESEYFKPFDDYCRELARRAESEEAYMRDANAKLKELQDAFNETDVAKDINERMNAEYGKAFEQEYGKVIEDEMTHLYGTLTEKAIAANKDYYEGRKRELYHGIANSMIADSEKKIKAVMSATRNTPTGFLDSMTQAMVQDPLTGYGRHANDDSYLQAAQSFLYKAKQRMSDVSVDNYQFGDFTKNVGYDLGGILESTMTFGLSDVRDRQAITNVLQKVYAAAQKSENPDDVLEHPEVALNERERAVYDAYCTMLAADLARKTDTSYLADAAKLTAEMIPFMLEVGAMNGIFGGLNEAVQQGLSRGLTRSVVSKLPRGFAKTAGRAATGLVKDVVGAGMYAAESGAMALVLPRTYANMLQNKIDVADNGGIALKDGRLLIDNFDTNTTADAFLKAWRDQWKELFTETGGVFSVAGNVLFRNPIVKKTFGSIKKTELGKLIDTFSSGKYFEYAKQMGYHGTYKEWLEEVEGTCWDYMFGQKDAFEQFFKEETQIPMLISFSVPSVLGGGVNIGREQYYRKQYETSTSNIMSMLKKHGYTDEDFADIKSSLYATSVEDLPIEIMRMASALTDTEQFGKIYSNYAMYSKKQKEGLKLTDEEQEKLSMATEYLFGDGSANAAETKELATELTRLAYAELALASVDRDIAHERSRAIEEIRSYVRNGGNIEQAEEEQTPMDAIRQESEEAVKKMVHPNGYVYGVRDAGDAEKTGFIVGGAVPVIDEDGETPRIVNNEVVTVRWADGTLSQVSAKDLDLTGNPMTAAEYAAAMAEQRNDQRTYERLAKGDVPDVVAQNGDKGLGLWATTDPNVFLDEYDQPHTREELQSEGWKIVIGEPGGNENVSEAKEPRQHPTNKGVLLMDGEGRVQEFYLTDNPNIFKDDSDAEYTVQELVGQGWQAVDQDATTGDINLVPLDQTVRRIQEELGLQAAGQPSTPVQQVSEEPQAPAANEPNVETMLAPELARSTIDFMGSKRMARGFLIAERAKVNALLEQAINAEEKGVINYTSPADYKAQVQQLAQNKQNLQDQLAKLNEAIGIIDAQQEAPAAPVTDGQGNPINADGTLALEPIGSIDQLTDDDFNNPSRNVQLPPVSKSLDAAIAANGRPVIIKKNVFEKNKEVHPEFDAEASRVILTDALYSTNMYGATQPITRPDYRVAIRTSKDANAVVVLDVYQNKDNVEIVGWRRVDEKGLNKMKRQAAREGGQLLILSPTNGSGSAAALSALPSANLSDGKGTTNNPNTQISGQKNAENVENANSKEQNENNAENPLPSEKKAVSLQQNGKATSKEEYRQQLADYLEGIKDADHQPYLCDNSTLVEAMKAAGASAKDVAKAQNVLSDGGHIEGFYLNGYVILNVDELNDFEKARSKYVHERQHDLTRKDIKRVQEVMKAASEQELKDILFAYTGHHIYDKSFYAAAADEFISFSMEEAYKADTDEELENALKGLGVKDELINIIKSINDEQRRNQSFALARRNAPVNQGAENRAAESGGNSKASSPGNIRQGGSNTNQPSLRRAESGRSGVSESPIDDEQRNDEDLSKARRDALVGRSTQGASGENAGDSQSRPGGNVVGQGLRPAGSSNQGTGSRGQVSGQQSSVSQSDASDVETGGALVEQLERMGVEVSTDLDANREALKAAKADKSDAGTIHYYKTRSGQQYGFSYKGKIYLDPRKVDANLPMHEYAHLWCDAFRRLNPQGWRNIIETIKADSDSWNFVKQQRPDLKTDDEIADEVIATFSGTRGAEKLKAELERMAAKDPRYTSKWRNIFKNISKAIQDFWKAVGDFLHIQYTNAAQVYDQVLKDFVDNMNPRKRVNDYLRQRNDAYMRAAEAGDTQTATAIFNEALRENIGNGITPYISAGNYNQLRRLAKGVKTRDAAVIREAAELIAPLIPENAVLVPAPSHIGKATDMLDLVNAIAEITGSDVADILTSAPRTSQYQQKKETGVPTSSQDLGITANGTIPEGKVPVVIDNVVDSGNTAEACVRALGKGVVVSLANSAPAYGHAASLKSAAPIVKDKNGNIIPLDKRFDLSGSKYLGRIAPQDVRFSISGTGVVKLGNNTLVGLHNINEDKLRKILKAGGMANPSAAVIDIARQNHEDYGAITLVLPNSLVENADTTYAGDAWTPIYPHVHYRLGKDTVKKIKKLVAGLPENLAYDIQRAIDDYMAENRRSSGLEYLFLKEKGIEQPILTNQRRFPDISIEDVYKRLGMEFPGYYDSSVFSAYEQMPSDQFFEFNLWLEKYGNQEEIDKIKNKIAELREKGLDVAADMLTERYSQPLFFNAFDSIAYRILRDSRDAGEENIPNTLSAADIQIDERGLRNEFEEWLRKVIDSLGYEEVLFAGYTPSGNRRYIPNTLENASRLMNKESQTNYLDRQSVNETKAMLMDRMYALSEIRKRKKLLEPDEEKIRTAYEEVSNDWGQLGIDFRDYTINEDKTAYGLDDNPFTAIDTALARLQEAMFKRDPIAYLNKEYRYSLPADSEFDKRLKEMTKRIKELPSRYFETKFRRPVYLNEFAAAVVPNDLAEDLKSGLTASGLPLYEYDRNVAGSRREATLQATDDEGIRFSISNANNDIFYSNAERAVETIKQEKATPEQWRAMIEKNGGLKAGEDKWIGLSEWLNEQRTAGIEPKRADETMADFAKRVAEHKVTLTKQQVLDYIRANKIQIEEVPYSKADNWENSPRMIALREEFDELVAAATAERDRAWEEDDEEAQETYARPADVAFDELVERYGDDFTIGFEWENTTDGPVIIPIIDTYSEQLNDYARYFLNIEEREINPTRLSYTTDGLENKREIALVVPTIASWKSDDSVHFGDAGGGKSVAWVRFGDAKDTEDNSLLVIDEIQSSRHQEGREKGYGTEQGVPAAPFEKNWYELAMKRMLRFAAENGYDKVAWTTGEQQAERYDIGKVVKDIEVSPWLDREEDLEDYDEPTRVITIYPRDGSAGMFYRFNKKGELIEVDDDDPKTLDALVGKDMARTLIETDKRLIKGEDLRIGGEGMKGFYDDILPRFMQKYGKKWGAQVGEVTMPKLAERSQTMHAVDVTPEMRESVLDGQPMFSISGGADSVKPFPYETRGEYMERIANMDKEPKPVGRGLLGSIYDQFKGKAKEAIEFLRRKQEGYAKDVLTHPQIKEGIGLYWGNDKAGLKKIVDKHPEVLDDLQGILDKTPIKTQSENRIVLESPIHRVVISKMLGKEKTDTWILSAYERKQVSASSSDIETESQKDKRDGTAASLSPVSDRKGTTNISNTQEKSEKNAEKDENVTSREQKPEGDNTLVLYYQELWDEAETDERRDAVLNEFITRIAGDSVRFLVSRDRDEMYQFLLDNGYSEELAEQHLGYALSKGFHGWRLIGGAILLNGEEVNSMEHAREVIVHEQQHTNNKGQNGVKMLSDTITNSTPMELAYFLRVTRDGRTSYDHLLENGASGFYTLAEEVIAYGVQFCYEAPAGVDIKQYLRDKGIYNDAIINIIYDEYERQRQSNPYFNQQHRWWSADSYNDVRNGERRGADERADGKESENGDGRRAGGGTQVSGRREEYWQYDPKELAQLRDEAIKVANIAISDEQSMKIIAGQSNLYADDVRFSIGGDMSRNDVVEAFNALNGLRVDAEGTKARNSRISNMRALRDQFDRLKRAHELDMATGNEYGSNAGRVQAEIEQGVRDRQSALKEEYQKSAKMITDFAKSMFRGKVIQNMTDQDFSRLLTEIRDASTKFDLQGSFDALQEVLDRVQVRYLKISQEALDKAANLPTRRRNVNGVDIGKTVDAFYHQALATFNELRNKSVAYIERFMFDLEDKLEAETDDTELGLLAAKQAAAQRAKQYLERRTELEQDIIKLTSDINQLDRYVSRNELRGNKRKEFMAHRLTLLQELFDKRDELILLNDQMTMDLADLTKGGHVKFIEAAQAKYAHKIDILRKAAKDLRGIRSTKGADGNDKGGLWNNYLAPLRTFTHELRKFGTHTAGGEGFLYEYFAPLAHDARSNYLLHVAERQEMLDDKVRELFGEGATWEKVMKKESNRLTDIEYTWEKMFENESEVNSAGLPKKKKDKPSYLTNGQIMYIYMVNKMRDGEVKLRNMGISEADVEFLKSKLPAKLVQLADWLQNEYFPTTRKRYNATNIFLYGTPMAEIPNYVPLRISADDLNPNVDIQQGNKSLLPSNVTGSAISRTYNQKSLDIRNTDAMQLVVDNMKEMEHWSAYAELITDLNTLLNSTAFKNRIEQMNPNNYTNFFKTCQLVVEQYSPERSSADALVTGLTRFIATSKISLRLWTALKQTLSAISPLSEADPEFHKQYIKAIMTSVRSFQWALDNLPIFRERWKGRQGGNEKLNIAEIDTKIQTLDQMLDWAQKNLVRLGIAPNAFVDAVVCANMAKAQYEAKKKYYTERGYSPEAVERLAKWKADEIYNETQQSSEGAYISAMQRDRTFLSSVISLFNNSSMAYARKNAEAMREFYKIAAGKKEDYIAFRKEQLADRGMNDEQAIMFAEQDYRRARTHAIADMAINGFVIQYVWNRGGKLFKTFLLLLPTLLFGNDDDKKRAWEEFCADIKRDLVVSGVQPIRGLAGGATIETALGIVYDRSISEKRQYLSSGQIAGMMDSNIHPAIQDISRLLSNLTKNEIDKLGVASQIVNILASSMTSIDTQTLAAMIWALEDLVEKNKNLTWSDIREDVAILLNVPPSQIERMVLEPRDKETRSDFVRRYMTYIKLKNYGVFVPVADTPEPTTWQKEKIFNAYK